MDKVFVFSFCWGEGSACENTKGPGQESSQKIGPVFPNLEKSTINKLNTCVT